MLSLALAFAALTYFSVPPPDAPQLAPRGTYSVGVRTVTITHKNQVDILKLDAKTGKAPLADRSLPLEIWYPATIPTGAVEATTYQTPIHTGVVPLPGKALRDAPPVNAPKPFPLVIVSHGYPGSRTFLTYITENLASKGYVVAAIDHTDSVTGQVRPFPSTLLNRSQDQWFTISEMGSMASDSGSFLHNLVDAKQVAIIGYSMGGYGALTSAGAGYSESTQLAKFVGGDYLKALANDNPAFRSLDRSALKCIVAIAPWGEQPPYSAWDAAGLAEIRVPSLFIAGDHDDVADYANGIRRAWDGAVNSQRYLLVYENARHNTGGNPPPPGVAMTYPLFLSYDEPVWRKDRITAINQHFITAFLDRYLKGDSAKAQFLDIPIPHSSDAKWTAPANAPDTGAFSTGKTDTGEPFWPGFQRRWALGLEWYSATPAH